MKTIQTGSKNDAAMYAVVTVDFDGDVALEKCSRSAARYEEVVQVQYDSG